MAMELLILVVCALALSITAWSQSSDGFISIDCGYDGPPYSANSNISYSGDDLYIDSGKNERVSADTNLSGLFRFYQTLRSFPDGKRNCYTLSLVQSGRKHLIRAEFMYGNFDGRNRPPSFDVYLGVHLWDSVLPVNFSRLEIITVSLSESVQVCLVNKGWGTPYITVLELRPLDDSMYPLANSSHALVLRGDRIDYGGKEGSSTRYPADPFDRIWFAPKSEQNWLPLYTNETKYDRNTEFRIPAAVLSTAVTTSSGRLEFNLTAVEGENTFIMMHFAEINRTKDNQVRQFDLYSNGSKLYADYRPSYLSLGTIYANSSGKGGTTNYSLSTTGEPTLRPIINALEILVLKQLSVGLSTEENDKITITKIKGAYKIKDWQGDPCFPVDLTWEGLICNYRSSRNPRIISLNLSHRGLEGGISPYIANLTALVSLDLSCNNLTGGIPDELGQLPELKFLNLTDNQLTGHVPPTLLEKSENNNLSLSTGGNPYLCAQINPCQPKRKTKKIIIPIVISVSVAFLLFLILMITWTIRRKRQKIGQGPLREIKQRHPVTGQFTYKEIVHMTKNFQQQIGRGGIAIVYRGQLINGREVAVKMISKTSFQSRKEFEAEAEILIRVHHKNLVSLIGYCSDQDNLALVYEFVSQGSLAEHLSDESASDLSWSIRLKIALDVAKGLDFLHSFCNPPIIHSDLKASNILLGEKCEAKLVDFGFPRLFEYDGSSCISRAEVSGTPRGYLDPEFFRDPVWNEKTDVYSFGIILLELITGQPPVINGIDIVSWVKSRIKRANMTEFLDQRIQENCDPSSIWKAAEIALKCTGSRVIGRPSMRDMVIELSESLASLSFQDKSTKEESEEQCLYSTFHVAPRGDESPLER